VNARETAGQGEDGKKHPKQENHPDGDTAICIIRGGDAGVRDANQAHRGHEDAGNNPPGKRSQECRYGHDDPGNRPQPQRACLNSVPHPKGPDPGAGSLMSRPFTPAF